MIVRSHGTNVRIANLTVGQMLGDGLRGGSSGGVVVTPKSVGGLAAFGRAISLAAEAVARRELAVFRGTEESKQRVTATWQARFFAGMPNERDSWFDILEWTEASLTGRNNALWLKLKDELGRIAGVYFIPRDRFEARWNSSARQAEYRVRAADGNSWSEWLDSSNVLHFRVGHVEPGCVIAPTPIEVYRDALKAALSKVRYESKHYDEGILQSLAVAFPGGVKPEQARRFRDMMKSEHGGVENAGNIRVFGNGATVSEIGVSLADAQFIESMNFDVEQISRIARVTSSLLGGATGAGVRTAPTPEHEEDRWFRYGLEPRLTRIEQTLRRDPDLFGTASRDFPCFLPAAIRSDAETESGMLVHEVQAGIITPNEARARKGMVPHPDGDVLQITPVGGAENPGLGGDAPASEPTPAPAPAEKTRERREDPMPTATIPQVNVYVEPTPVEVTVPAPQITVNVEPTPITVTPEIHVEQAPITVAAPEVTVNVEPPNLTLPPINVDLHMPDESEPKKTVEFKRNTQGLITGAEITEG